MAGAGVALATLSLVVAMAGPGAACVVTAFVNDLARDPGPTPEPRMPYPEQTAQALLGTAAQASEELPYEGTQFISSWGRGGSRTVLMEVAHVPGGGTLMTVIGTPADPGAKLYDEDGLPARAASLGGTSDAVLRLLGRNYALAPVGYGSVAGRTATVVEARRSDGSLAARFWLDRDAGLMLRRQVFDRHGRVVRMSAFFDIQVNRASFDMRLPQAMPAPWEHQLSRSDLAALRAHGWTIPGRLPDGLVLVEARKKQERGGTVLHLGYSDGLSMVSLFVQRGKLDTDKFETWQRAEFAGNAVYVLGAAQERMVWAGPDQVYTLVADAPAETVRAAVAALPHDDRRGFWHRVARGLNRIGSWFNPFG